MRNKMELLSIINLEWMILCTLALLYSSSAITNKARLCVEYEIADHFTQEEVFSVIPGYMFSSFRILGVP